MKKFLLLSGSSLVLAWSVPAWAQSTPGSTIIEELVVTAQKKEESVQDVPIAVSAFSEKSLKAQGIDGPRDLVQSVPNVTFQRRNLRTNFQIRGVGAQLTATGGDDGVGIHVNNAPLTSNRIAEAEFYDVERVEVLRGPQGTLFGRNATGGVVNVITNKPSDHFSASVTAELGNFNSRKMYGFVNVPLGSMFDLRVAGFGLQRDGYTKNTLTGQDIDNRKISAGRATLAFHPTDNFRASLMWDGFSEDDSRGARKQLCVKDPGLTSVLGVSTGAAQATLTQGCLPATVYAGNVYGTTNQLSTFSGIIARQVGLQPVDSFLGKTVSKDLRQVEVVGQPKYRPRSDLYELDMQWDATDALKVTSLTSYNENENYARGDSTGGYPSVPFPVSLLAPTGKLTDGQLGTTDRLQSESGLDGHNTQWTQELRLQSAFEGPFNFNVGGIYLNYKARSISYVATNAATAAVKLIAPTAYIDPLSNPDYTGHNYFVSLTDYKLVSKAVFGEVYWQATPDLRATLGLRYTDDAKRTIGSGSTLFAPGRGPIFTALQTVEFKETTGRLNVDWTPTLSFTDKTLIYASYSKGYKGGGFNPPGVVALGLSPQYQPEFVNALEVGAKNTLLGGRLLLNLTGFYYDYKGYQIGRSVNRSVFNDNIDATIKGLEFESIFEPMRGLRLSANLGYLDTRIDKGRVVDPFNRTQGDARYIYANSTSGGCVLNAQGLSTLLATPAGPAIVNAVACSGPTSMTSRLTAAGVPAATASALAAGVYSYDASVSKYSSGTGEGVFQNLGGNELPNAPKFTASVGAQYAWELGDGWNATLRGDYYRQAKSFARYNNAFFDELRAWSNVNATLTVAKPDLDLTIQVFVKNALSKDTIVGVEIADENLGASRSPILLDPRMYGISITKGF